jgi:serine kinase of HPr protein (carbohydrate metabolism regulator)
VILHAGLIALRLGGFWRGALIQGPSGTGKSDLALRALDAGFRLVADDRTLVWRSGGGLFGRAPEPLRGLIEARGHGVLTEPSIALAEIVVCVACVAPPDEIERLPDLDAQQVEGVLLPRLALNPLEPSAPAKLRRAMQHLGVAAQQAYQASSCGGGGRSGIRGYPLRPRL